MGPVSSIVSGAPCPILQAAISVLQQPRVDLHDVTPSFVFTELSWASRNKRAIIGQRHKPNLTAKTSPQFRPPHLESQVEFHKQATSSSNTLLNLYTLERRNDCD